MSTVCEEIQQQQDVPDLIPARMLNEFAYCPRLAYLEWVQGEFADNLETNEGRFGHRRVDKPDRQELPEPVGQNGSGPHPNPLPEGEGTSGPHPGPLPEGSPARQAGPTDESRARQAEPTEFDTAPGAVSSRLAPNPARQAGPTEAEDDAEVEQVHSRSVMLSASGRRADRQDRRARSRKQRRRARRL